MAKYSKNDIIRIVDEEDIEFIRLQFTDIFGTLKNVLMRGTGFIGGKGRVCKIFVWKGYFRLCKGRWRKR